MTVSPATVAPGDAVRVRAGFLWSDCYDTGRPGTPPPSQDVAIDFRPHGSSTSVHLAAVDADARGRIDVEVGILADAPHGTAALLISGFPAAVEVAAP